MGRGGKEQGAAERAQGGGRGVQGVHGDGAVDGERDVTVRWTESW
jgi:hypothetical protein